MPTSLSIDAASNEELTVMTSVLKRFNLQSLVRQTFMTLNIPNSQVTSPLVYTPTPSFVPYFIAFLLLYRTTPS